MSKVICDVCGTTFPETASVCPICGCAKNTTEQTAAESAQQGEGGYSPVKGGRFSKSNVRKRNKKAKQSAPAAEPKTDGGDRVNMGLVAVILILLLAIVAVLIYIGVRFLFPSDKPDVNDPGVSQTTGDVIPSTSSTPSLPEEIFCTGLKLSNTTIEFSEKDVVWVLSVEKEPADTTDEVTFTSSNEQVATVDEKGKIVAVGGGEAVITVKCGDQTAECKISCTFTDPSQVTTQPTEPPVELPEGFELKLNRTDFTLSAEGSTWTLYRETNGVKASDITWTSDDPDVASVDENGVVTAVGKGETNHTKIHASIGDQTVSCIVRVAFKAADSGDETTETTGVKISHTDVTIEVGETFMLTLTNSEGAKIQVEWTASEEGFVTIDGSRITGAATAEDGKVKRVEISTTYEEKTYTCVVRVKEKAE